MDVWGAHPIDGQLHAAELRNEVAVEGAVVEEEVVAQAGAAARLDSDAQRQVVTTLLIQQRLRLRGGGIGQDCAVGAGGCLVLNSHYFSPVHVRGWTHWVDIINGTLFAPYSRFIPRSPRPL